MENISCCGGMRSSRVGTKYGTIGVLLVEFVRSLISSPGRFVSCAVPSTIMQPAITLRKFWSVLFRCYLAVGGKGKRKEDQRTNNEKQETRCKAKSKSAKRFENHMEPDLGSPRGGKGFSRRVHPSITSVCKLAFPATGGTEKLGAHGMYSVTGMWNYS